MSHFFENQKIARAKSRNIILVFLLFLALQLAAFYYLISRYFGPIFLTENYGEYTYVDRGYDPLALKFAIFFAAVLTILFLFKRVSFFSNPSSIPEAMSAKQVLSTSKTPEEQIYYNIVSEMSLASGIPMPKVYVLKQEQAINAFTSGYSHQNANIVVTQGALESFTRDELQAVVAHEFGHIVSGDVKANINLLAVYFSFSAVFIVGMRIFEVLARTGSHRGRSSKKGGGAGQLMLVVVAIIILGAVGAFVSRIISAMFSRQREYLADALSVQFTRYPAALASSLAKIRDGGGSILKDVRGAEVSAICFSSSLKWMSSVYDTHPPLDSRIKKIDPAFVKIGSSFKKRIIDVELKKENLKVAMSSEKSAQYLATMGLLTENDIRNAEASLKEVKDSRLSGYLNPRGLEPLVYALLLDEDPMHLAEQKELLFKIVSEETSHKTLKAFEALHEKSSLQKTSIVELLIPLFDQISASVSMRVLDNSKKLVDLDGEVTAFESFLYLFIKKYNFGLEGRGGKPSPADLVYLIDQMSKLNSGDSKVADSSCKEALKIYFGKEINHSKTSGVMEEVLLKLSNMSLENKERLIQALLKVITFDEHLNRKEFECFRIVCDALEVPAPPINI